MATQQTSPAPVCNGETKTHLGRRYRVLLHNDDVNACHEVVVALQLVWNFNQQDATAIMWEAHNTGVALCRAGLSCEHAEFKIEQMEAHYLTATMEPEP